MRSARVELILDTLRAVRGAKDLSKSVDELADNMTAADRAGTKAGQAIDAAGGEMSDAARAAANLDREIDKLSGSLRELAIAQALTGDGMGKQMREQEAQLRRLTKNRKLFGDMGAEAAPEFSASFVGRLGPLLAKMPVGSPIIAAVAAAGVAAAPLLGAAISGAIIGGVGAGGVIGGLVLVSKDERVKAAADGFGNRLEQRLFRAGGAFVKPAIDGLQQVEQALETVDLEGMLRDASQYVPVLAGGVSTLITELGDGVESLIDNAGGPVQAISDGIAGIGEHLSTGLQGMAGNSAEATAGLSTLFGVVNSAIDSTFNLVNLLTELYGISQKIGGDFVLQTFLKLTGAQMDQTAESNRILGEGSFATAEAMKVEADNADLLKEVQKELTAAQKLLSQAQGEYKTSLDNLAPAQGRAAELADGLRTASTNLFGAQIAGVEANEAYQRSWDSLSESVKKNKGSLDLHTVAGRANRDSLQGLLGASNEMYFANIAQGQSTDTARKKHEARTEAVRKEAIRLGLNKTETDKLIATYGKIPGKKTTNLVQTGLDRIANQLEEVYYAQRALAEGKPIAEVRRNAFAAKGGKTLFKGFSDGGFTGEGGKYEPKGVVHGGEWVFDKETTKNIRRQNPGFLEETLAGKRLPGYAGGGLVAPVESRTGIPMKVDLSKSFVMSMEKALAKVTPAVPAGGGPTSNWIEATARALVPGIRTLSKDRPGATTLSGNRSYHSMRRAVDFEPSEKLARLWNERYKARTKEFISPYQQYNINNGRDWTATGAVWNQHNFAGGNPHDHIAMINGGTIREPVFGVGRSGRTYSFAENGRPERVLPAGRSGAAAPVIHVAVHVAQTNANPRQIANAVGWELGRQADIFARSGG